ncbi:TolC family protein [Chryseolinea sp. H1M3-3]|uniref:TolC family protein n=1 Tax=Chryseolinea sp. H1M3-3 TaxID=3034144 RepID=UPI0023EB39AD|nr:TolC family protein [Chryseolinea sp. H1M3-3]
MKKVFPLLLIFTITFSASLLAQDTVLLSLQEALDASLNNNKEIVIARLEEEGASARFNQTNAVFLPQVKLSYTALSTNNPLNAFGFKLQQESIAQSDFNPELLNNPASTQNFMTKAEFQQPLLNMDMLHMRKAAQQQVDVYTFKTKRTKDYLVFEVQKAYAQLQLAHQANSVLGEALKTVNSIYTATANRYEKGFLQKSDLLQVQVQVTNMERQSAEAKSNVRNASDYLSLLMGKQSGVVYQVEPVALVTKLEGVETQVPENRADFRALQSAVTAHDMMISSSKMSYLPKLNAFGEYLINDKDAFGFGANSYLVGAQLSWTIFNGTATRNKIAEHRAERNKAAEQLQYQKEQSQLELNKTLRQWEDALIALQQQELAVSQASEALRILQNRYNQGLVTTNDILQSQTLLSQQKLYQAQTVFQFNTTQAYLQFLTITSEK